MSYLSKKFLISHAMMMMRCTRNEIQKLIGIENRIKNKMHLWCNYESEDPFLMRSSKVTKTTPISEKYLSRAI
jgi:hypothetical protein